jgi:hypothetical protein
MPWRGMEEWIINPHFLDLDTSWRWVVSYTDCATPAPISLCICIYIPFSLLGNGSVKSYLGNEYTRNNERIFGRVFSHEAHVEWKGSRRLVLPRIYCFKIRKVDLQLKHCFDRDLHDNWMQSSRSVAHCLLQIVFTGLTLIWWEDAAGIKAAVSHSR